LSYTPALGDDQTRKYFTGRQGFGWEFICDTPD